MAEEEYTQLSSKQRQALKLVLEGKSERQVAAAMNLTVKRVHVILKAAAKHMRASTNKAAAQKARDLGQI